MYRLCQVSSEAEPDGVMNIYNPVPGRLRLEGCRFKANLDCLARVYGECKDTMLVSPTLAPQALSQLLWEEDGLLGLRRSAEYVYRWALQGEN